MFGRKRDKLADALRGALKPVAPVNAPTLEFRKTSLERSVDLRKYCSPIINQEPLNSCGACATVSALELLAGKQGEPQTRLSILFVYYNARRLLGNTGKDTGLLSSHAPAAVLAFGVCSDVLWPYKPDAFTKEPPVSAYLEAKKFEATQYARIGSADEAKASLSQGIPVIFGANIPHSYYVAAGASPRGLMPEWGTIDPGGDTGHAMLAVGYDETEKWFLVKNSLGGGFGDHGYVRIPYSVLETCVWREDMWAIGELEKAGERSLRGATMMQAVADARSEGPRQMDAALAEMRKTFGQELQTHLDETKTSIRDRLRAQEDRLAQNRNRGGGGEGGNG